MRFFFFVVFEHEKVVTVLSGFVQMRGHKCRDTGQFKRSSKVFNYRPEGENNAKLKITLGIVQKEKQKLTN